MVGHHNEILGHDERVSYSLLWIVVEVPSECPVLTEIPESVSTHAKEYGMTLTLIASTPSSTLLVDRDIEV